MKKILSILLSAALVMQVCLSGSTAFSTVSAAASLRESSAKSGVSQGPVITCQPRDCSVTVNGKAIFSISAEGEELSYQWQQLKTAEGSSWVSISTYEGCKTDTLTAPAYEGRDGYRYRCLITDKYGSKVYSDEAVMHLLPAVTITKNPENVTAELYSDATFHVEASGEGLRYQWQYFGPSSEKWLPVTTEIFGSFSGADTGTFTFRAEPQLENKYQIRCVVTDAGGNNARSAQATLKITCGGSCVTVSAESFGADGSDTEDDRKAIQTALNFARDHATADTPVTVTLGSGTFCLVESLMIYSHTRFVLSDDTILSYCGSGGCMLQGGDGTQARYDTLTDIVISGGLWKGNASATGYQTEPIGIKSANTVTISGLRMEDSSDHFIMLTGVSGSLVTGCSFKDYFKISETDQFTKEAVHIDLLPMADGSLFPSKNAVVENCTFDSVASGIGTHNYGFGKYETDITMRECTFKNLIYNCINAYSMKGLSISGCRAEGCGAFLNMRDSEGTVASNTVQGSGSRCFTIIEGSAATVRDCHISGTGRLPVPDGESASNTQTIAVFAKKASVVIDNNEFSDLIGTPVMVRESTSPSVIKNNIISTATEQGIFISGENTTIANNTLSDCKGIWFEYGEGQITGNSVSGCSDGITLFRGKATISDNTVRDSTGSGIMVKGAADQNGIATVENNTIIGSGTCDLSISSNCSQCVVRNNNTEQPFTFNYSLKSDIVASDNGIAPPPGTPSVSCTASDTQITLTWQATERTAYYVIYSFNPQTQTLKRLAVTNETQYDFTGLAENTEYSFLVVSRDEDDLPCFYTYPTNTVSAVTGVHPEAPEIISQPQNISAQDGDEISFSVKATGSDLSYQWYFKKFGSTEWTLWNGHTGSSTVGASNASWNGMQVRCEITDAQGRTICSDPAVITIGNELTIISQSGDVNAGVGDTVSFRVEAEGPGLSYQWYFKKADSAVWSLWKGHDTAATSAVTNASWDGMQVRCKVSDIFENTLWSAPVTISISQPLKIISQPSDVTVNLGDTVRLSLEAEGLGVKYQWYFRKAGQTEFSEWKNHTGTSETVTPNATWDGIQLYCLVTDKTGASVQSENVTVTILQTLEITRQPENQTITLGDPLALSIEASGIGLQYQWYFRKSGQTEFSQQSDWSHASETFTPDVTWDGAQLY